MTYINQDYQYTKVWDDIDNVILEQKSLYIYAHDPEDRSVFCAQKLQLNNTHAKYVELNYDDENDSISIVGGAYSSFSLYSTLKLSEFFAPYKDYVIYLEVTGLSCRVAAPIMKYAMENDLEVRIVYAEPFSYKIKEFHKMGLNKDLSETVNGIDPLPGLISLIPHKESPLFVVMLGFEGGRFSQIIQDQNPDNDKIIPVLGVPGYKMNYPYISLLGNKSQILNTGCWQTIKYAEANSIVDSYMLLQKLSYKNRDPEMVVAPIGTKPHAIGAILYSLKHPNKVEIVYDNPKRSVHRTDGIGKVLVCNITKLYKEN